VMVESLEQRRPLDRAADAPTLVRMLRASG
jgi:hypothetical protein